MITRKLEGVYATIVDLANLSTRVVSFGSMLKRAKSLWHLKTAQKPEERLRNALAREGARVKEFRGHRDSCVSPLSRTVSLVLSLSLTARPGYRFRDTPGAGPG